MEVETLGPWVPRAATAAEPYPLPAGLCSPASSAPHPPSVGRPLPRLSPACPHLVST